MTCHVTAILVPDWVIPSHVTMIPDWFSKSSVSAVTQLETDGLRAEIGHLQPGQFYTITIQSVHDNIRSAKVTR